MVAVVRVLQRVRADRGERPRERGAAEARRGAVPRRPDRKSTRLNSSHSQISYVVFCFIKKPPRRDRAGETDDGDECETERQGTPAGFGAADQDFGAGGGGARLPRVRARPRQLC